MLHFTQKLTFGTRFHSIFCDKVKITINPHIVNNHILDNDKVESLVLNMETHSCYTTDVKDLEKQDILYMQISRGMEDLYNLYHVKHSHETEHFKYTFSFFEYIYDNKKYIYSETTDDKLIFLNVTMKIHIKEYINAFDNSKRFYVNFDSLSLGKLESNNYSLYNCFKELLKQIEMI